MKGPSSPTRAALDTAGGILLSASVVYFALHGGEILRGAHTVDWSLLRALCLIGLLTLGYSFYENQDTHRV
ncbi:hypothetical protein [Lewinella sp. IMCC34183]|uniref:hypothetical protein n=1 Tax=Lewinella sp. IMCC34183 TaxID=2248762 RepID=UPI000E23EEDC|nr:hypothetical protein [Lewinella sp. IMCC34183]